MRRLWVQRNGCLDGRSMRRYEAVGAEDGRLTFWGAFRRLWRRRGMRREGFAGCHGAARLHRFPYAPAPLRHDSEKPLPVWRGVPSGREIIERGRARLSGPPILPDRHGLESRDHGGGALVTREDLDRISTDIPVCMLRTCLHYRGLQLRNAGAHPRAGGCGPRCWPWWTFPTAFCGRDAARLYMKVLPRRMAPM